MFCVVKTKQVLFTILMTGSSLLCCHPLSNKNSRFTSGDKLAPFLWLLTSRGASRASVVLVGLEYSARQPLFSKLLQVSCWKLLNVKRCVVGSLRCFVLTVKSFFSVTEREREKVKAERGGGGGGLSFRGNPPEGFSYFSQWQIRTSLHTNTHTHTHLVKQSDHYSLPKLFHFL